MVLVEPDMIFRRLAQIIGIRPIMYDEVMVVVASWIIGGPSDDGEVVVGNFAAGRLWISTCSALGAGGGF
jgi:hypothetical protein